MRPVPVKCEEQQAALMLTAMRDRLVRARTRLTNAIRGHAAEFGLMAAKGLEQVGPLLEKIAAETVLPELARELFAGYGQEYAALLMQIAKVERQLLAWHRGNELSRRLAEIPSIGSIGASLLVMRSPDPHGFPFGARLRGLDRAYPEGSLHCRQDAAGHNHTRRRRGLAQHPGCGCDGCDPAGRREERTPRLGWSSF